MNLPALLALTAGAFGIGTTEFVIMGLLEQVAADLNVSLQSAGMLITGYALGVAAGAPVLTLATRRLPRKTVLLALMVIFTVGNVACALAPDYGLLMAGRIVTALAHGTFFGVGSVVATGLVPPQRRASAIAIMFTGLTAATLLGVPAGAWLGWQLGWRATFWAVAGVGLVALAILAVFVPAGGRAAPPVAPLREELAVLQRPGVLAGLAITVFGFAGLFAVFTYIQSVLLRVTGLSEASVSGLLLVFGAGLAVGNLLGGRLADRAPLRAIVATLAALTLVLAIMPMAVDTGWRAALFLAALGIAAFATAAPLQAHVLDAAAGAGESLAASLNIAAFNVGNALGAWAGGLMLAQADGVRHLGWVGASLSLIGLTLALWRQRRAGNDRAPAGRCPASA